jgi:hypothetical protein
MATKFDLYLKSTFGSEPGLFSNCVKNLGAITKNEDGEQII